MTNALRKTMLSTICMLVVAVLSLTGVTYAWFTSGNEAIVDGMSMSVEAADGGLMISTTSATAGFASKVNLTNATKEGVSPVSSYDGENFFSAIVNPENPAEIKTTAIGSDNANIWSQEFWVKNTGYSEISVSLTADQTTPVFASNDNLDNRKAEDMAKLAVFQIDDDGTETLLYIYSQGSDNYKGVIGASYVVDDPETEDVDEGVDTFFNASTDTTYLNQEAHAKFKTTASDCTFTIEGGTTGEDGALVEPVVHIKVVVWIEGQDQQCVNQNAASSFDLNLIFTATEVE